jgi:SAM-dependent methyltransferase
MNSNSSEIRAYDHLSKVYDLDWGKWSKMYLDLIDKLLAERGITEARILDLGCGTGTLGIELTNKGHFVHGIDISSEMIEVAKSKSLGIANIKFEVRDLRGFSSNSKFDLIICTFDAFNYLLDINDVKALFNDVAVSLKKNGLFIFDSNTERMYIKHNNVTYERKLGSAVFSQKLKYDVASNMATTIFEFSDGAVEAHMQRPYNLDVLYPILVNKGFRVVNAFSEFAGKEFTSESERLICVAETIR